MRCRPTRWHSWRRAVRSRRRTIITTTRSSCRRFRKAPHSACGERSMRCLRSRSQPCVRSRSTMPPRSRSTTPSRWTRAPTAAGASASTSLRRRSAFRVAPRSTGSRASACPRCTCRDARSRCCPTPVVDAFTLAAGAARPALSLYVDVAADGALLRHETRVERVADHGEPAARRDHGALRCRRCRRLQTRSGRRSCACCGVSRRRSPSAAARPTSIGSTTASTWTGMRCPRDACGSCRARAARRSTSSSPS